MSKKSNEKDFEAEIDEVLADLAPPGDFARSILSSIDSHRVEGSPARDGCRVSCGIDGIMELIPFATNHNLVDRHFPGWNLETKQIDSPPQRVDTVFADLDKLDANRVFAWEVNECGVSGRMSVTPHPAGAILTFLLTIEEAVEWLCPIAIPVSAREGLLLLPGEKRPFDPADPINASRRIPLGEGKRAAWSLGSQNGLLVSAIDTSRAFEALRVDRLSEEVFVLRPVFEDLEPGDQISGRIDLTAVPFNGAITLEQVIAHAALRREDPIKPLALQGDPVTTGDLAGLQWKALLQLDGTDITVTARDQENRPIDATHAAKPHAEARRVKLGKIAEEVWEVTVTFEPVESPMEVRLEAEIATPCANPSWDGDATVIIPGNFARTNFHPDHPHGGGPKYGPAPIPEEREPNTANDEAPGACHGWTFSASRLPQCWAAALDKAAGKMVWVGTEPRSALGESAVGFVSPAGDTTSLKVATPTTCEPWVPLGYSRMRREPLREAAFVDAGQVVTWRFYVAIREIKHLNVWAPLDQALYEHCRPFEPHPVKLPLDHALDTCASALFERFYDPERRALAYSTGPDGQHAILGFTGMAHSALVLLEAGHRRGNKDWEEAGIAVLDTVAEMFLAGPGFPWTAFPKGDPAARAFVAGSGEPGYIVLVAFMNLAEAVRAERARGRTREEWEKALRRCADHWLKNQSDDGAYPHWGPDFSRDFKENEYTVTNIEAGTIANMVDAYELFGEDKYLVSARQAADYYRADLDAGRLYGGPGDIQALVNSEVPMFTLRGYRRLAEVTRDPDHKRLMLAAAAWRLSFQYAHSWAVAPGTPLWRQGWAGLGAESASACNLHTVSLGCVNIPDYHAIWKITGDDYYLRRARDLAQYATQQYARFPGDLSFPFAGAGTESFWASESVWGKGVPWIFTDPGFDLGFMSWVTGWSGYGALAALALSL